MNPKWYTEEAGFFGLDLLEEYQDRIGPAQTRAEVDFVGREAGIWEGAKVLDLACGGGRHAIELARRGCTVTAQDINRALVDRARSDAAQAGVDVRWVLSDMREIAFRDAFDLVISLSNSFGYLEADEEDRKVVHQVAGALKPGGRFVLELMNRDHLARGFPERETREIVDGSLLTLERRFDPTTNRYHVRHSRSWPDGRRREAIYSPRLYTLGEAVRLCEAGGLRMEKSFGGSDSSPFTEASAVFILIARKGGGAGAAGVGPR